MTTLTQCQQQVLDMLISYQKERGFPPTNQEVATMLGYRSVNAAVEHLRALEKKGVITIKRGVARGITLHTAVKDDDSEAVGIIRALLASCTGEKRRHHDKAWRGPGHHASYRGEGRRQRSGRYHPRTACR